MTEKILYGPIEILPSSPVDGAILEIEGITKLVYPYTTYVFLDEIHEGKIEELIQMKSYTGCFSIIGGSSESIFLDITQVLNRTLETRPNFHISFLTPSDSVHDVPLFGFKHLHIHRTPAMDTHPVTHTITPESFFKEVAGTW